MAKEPTKKHSMPSHAGRWARKIWKRGASFQNFAQ